MKPHTREEKLQAFGRMADVLDELREKCPWDRKQTNESLRANTIEEVYELSDALERGDSKDICEELGDVLLHVCFYAKIASEQGRFDIADVCSRLTAKLIFRHPHIYGGAEAGTADEVETNWEKLKRKEKGGNKTALAGVPPALPSLIKALRIQEKAARTGFDWKRKEEVWDKVREELSELEAAMKSGIPDDREEEFGDLLFSLVNAARLCGVNPDNALERANRKFIARFGFIEREAASAGRRPDDMSLEEMDALWDEAKRREKRE